MGTSMAKISNTIPFKNQNIIKSRWMRINEPLTNKTSRCQEKVLHSFWFNDFVYLTKNANRILRKVRGLLIIRYKTVLGVC